MFFAFQLSLLTLAAATSAQLTYPASTAPLVYAAGFGYNAFGLQRNDGAPPNNPFILRTAADVFTPEAVPVAVAP